MSENRSTLQKILLPIAIVEALIIVFLLFQVKSKSDEVTQLTEVVENKDDEVISKTKELENIQADFERVKSEREKLGLKNDSLDIQMATLSKTISELKRSKKLDAGKRAELEKLVSQLRYEITKRDQEIVTLQAANDSLNTDLTNTKTEKAKLGDSLSNVASKKQDLEGKLAYASVLKAQEFKITVLKENGKEIEDDEYKASKINRIKVVFSLADNKAADKNNKDFLLRLVTPGGEAFSDPANGGGTVSLADGSTINYTQKQSLGFDNSGQKVTFTSFAGLKYIPGTYTVEIYCEGYKIGSGNFKVK